MAVPFSITRHYRVLLDSFTHTHTLGRCITHKLKLLRRSWHGFELTTHILALIGGMPSTRVRTYRAVPSTVPVRVWCAIAHMRTARGHTWRAIADSRSCMAPSHTLRAYVACHCKRKILHGAIEHTTCIRGVPLQTKDPTWRHRTHYVHTWRAIADSRLCCHRLLFPLT